MPNALRPCVVLLATLAVLLSARTAQADILRVDAAGGGAYTDIQAAVDAAQAGDLILVRSGLYSGVVIDGKSLDLAADAAAEVTVDGTITVRNLPCSGLVLLSAIDARGDPGLHLVDNEGHVRLQSCDFRGGDLSEHGALVERSRRVAFADCTLTGGEPQALDNQELQGGAGALSVDSSVQFDACELTGGQGQSSEIYFGDGGPGGPGVRVEGWGAVLTGCALRGGMGGSGYNGGGGGNGLEVAAGTQVHMIRSTALPGSLGFWDDLFGGSPGARGVATLVFGNGNLFEQPGEPRNLSAPTLASDGTALPLVVSGIAGDRIWIAQAGLPGFLFEPGLGGIWLVPVPPKLTLSPQVVLRETGEQSLDWWVADHAPATPWRRRILQQVVLDASGDPKVGGVAHVLVLQCDYTSDDCNLTGSSETCAILFETSHDCNANGVLDACEPDCDGDGVIDACAIADGQPDLNGNGVPDVCEPTTVVWYVDASAPAGGDGSAASPFANLAAAFEVVLPGHEIQVADGVYTGPQNRGLDCNGLGFVLRSENGPANCIIDCEGQDRAFVQFGAQHGEVRIQGLTIRNAVTTSLSGGGAILLVGGEMLVKDCVFEDCAVPFGTGSQGGAIRSWVSTLTVQGSRFRRCSSTLGGAIHMADGTSELVGCLFESNEAQYSGGAVHSYAMDPSAVRHCVFRGNESLQGSGGALYSEGAQDLLVDHALLVGNRAPEGGALSARGNLGDVPDLTLSNSTLMFNEATSLGGALRVAGGIVFRVRNSILWSNSSADGFPIRLLDPGSTLQVAWSDVDGGPASVLAHPSAQQTWGPGVIDLDPRFVDPIGPDGVASDVADGNWRLAPDSPCLDAGDNDSVALDAFDLDGDRDTLEPTPLDLDLTPRFVDDPAPDTGAGTAPLVDLGPYER